MKIFFKPTPHFNIKYGRPLLVAFVAVLAPLLTYAQSPDSIIGIWNTAHGKGHIKVMKDESSGKFSGKIIWLKNSTDKNGQPVVDQNGKAVLGLTVLKDMIFDDDEWIDGTIYDPESGKTYYCTITLENDSTLEVRGSLDSMGWIGRTQEWVKVEE